MKKLFLFFLVLFGLFNIVHSANYETSIRWDATSATGGSAIGRFSSNQFFSSAQSFNITENANLNNISVRVGTFAGTSRNYYLEIVTGDVNNNTVLCSSDNTLISSTGEFNFVFSSACSLNQGQTYWYRFIRVGTFNSGDYAFLYNTGGTDYYGTTFFNTRSEQTTDSYLWNQPNTALDISSKLFYSTSDLAITINNPLNNEYLDNTSFLVNVTTTEITDLYYILNGGSQTSLCSSCNATTNTLIGVEGLNNLTIISNQSGSITNESISFTIDTTQPIIINNLPSEINSYTLNFNSTTCSDTNLDTCILSIQGSNYDLLTLSNASLTYNGNWSYNITATDLAGTQVQESEVILVNPEVDIQVRDGLTNVLLSNWDLGSFSTTTDTLTINIYDLGLGSHILPFVKSGYDLENQTITFTDTTSGTITLYINSVTLFASAYDGDTLTPIIFDVQIKNSTDVITFTGLTNLSQSFNSIPTGDIELTFSNSNYSNALFYTTITPFSSVSFDVYLTPLNLSSIITFSVTDIATRQYLEGVTVEARRSIGNETITIQQTKTSSTGIAYLILDELKDYEYIFTKDGYTQAIINSIPGVTTYNVRLNQEGETFTFLNGVNIRYYPQTAQLYQNTSYNFTTQVTADSITRIEYLLLNSSGGVIDGINSTNPTGSTFTTNFNIPIDYDSNSITSQIVVYINGESFTHSKKWVVAGVLQGELKAFQDFGKSTDEEYILMKFFIIIVTYLVVIILGNKNPITRDFVSIIAILPTVIYAFLGWIPLLYATVISIALFILYLGGNKR